MKYSIACKFGPKRKESQTDSVGTTRRLESPIAVDTLTLRKYHGRTRLAFPNGGNSPLAQQPAAYAKSPIVSPANATGYSPKFRKFASSYAHHKIATRNSPVAVKSGLIHRFTFYYFIISFSRINFLIMRSNFPM